MALLNAEDETLQVKLFVAIKYLDICRQLNQLRIYRDNARLAHHRLDIIRSLHQQGTVTYNDVLRTEIEINDYELAVRRTGNAIIRLNTELNMVLGQPDSLRLMPDTSLLVLPASLPSLEHYLSVALQDNPHLNLSRLESRSAALRVDEQKAERLPTIALHAESNLVRPYVYTIPAIDIYYNVWEAGIGIHYNLGSLYKSSARIKGSRLDLDISRTRDTLTEQQLTVSVKNAYNQFRESFDKLETARRDVASANETYRIVEEKYRNQLSLITELIDAIDTQTAAEIRVNDALIDTVYTYYQLQQYTGRL